MSANAQVVAQKGQSIDVSCLVTFSVGDLGVGHCFRRAKEREHVQRMDYFEKNEQEMPNSMWSCAYDHHIM